MFTIFIIIIILRVDRLIHATHSTKISCGELLLKCNNWISRTFLVETVCSRKADGDGRTVQPLHAWHHGRSCHRYREQLFFSFLSIGKTIQFLPITQQSPLYEGSPSAYKYYTLAIKRKEKKPPREQYRKHLYIHAVNFKHSVSLSRSVTRASAITIVWLT